MHLFDLEIGLMGGNGIVGGGLPLAGRRLLGPLSRHRSSDRLLLRRGCRQPRLHARVDQHGRRTNTSHHLRLREQPLCGHDPRQPRTVPVEHVADRAAGYGIPGEVVDGNDVLAVYARPRRRWPGRGKAGGRPSWSAKTYRHRPHCMVIPEHRPEQEREAWKGAIRFAVSRSNYAGRTWPRGTNWTAWRPTWSANWPRPSVLPKRPRPRSADRLPVGMG